MSDTIRIQLQPLGRTIKAPRGTPLREVLFPHGVEFPCGGRGRCRGCKVKVLSGELATSEATPSSLTADELKQGWRLACQSVAISDVTLEMAQWEATVLADSTVFTFAPQSGLGIAIDLGTTTIVAQLLDLQTGCVLNVRTALNVQAKHGADIMSRIAFAVLDQGQKSMQTLIRDQLGRLITELLSHANQPADHVDKVIIVGNTVMHHLFGGIDVTPLSHYPFETHQDGLLSWAATDIGWTTLAQARVYFLPCLGGFVGSDILAGILATNLGHTNQLSVLIDLGTNGEIVVGHAENMLCASTAAGPAFEGARISMGMRAATGAISSVRMENGRIDCQVIGQTTPRGICGSGLVDATALGLELGQIQPNGRLVNPERIFPLTENVHLTQADIRELQLAKGAIAAGIRLLLDQWGAAPAAVKQVYLAGAFGNYINRRQAQRIGLYAFHPEHVRPAGNTALLGAKMALFSDGDLANEWSHLRRRIRHVDLKADQHFEDVFAEEMGFPPP